MFIPLTERTDMTGPATPTDDPRWTALVSRDASFDGRFVYSVRTTGIYCRPSCGARRPNRKNVDFHENPDEAEAAGFRACRRCRPNVAGTAHAAAIADACRRIEAAESAPALAALARDAGLSPHHFHRLFKAATGLTPKAYGDATRARRMRAALETGDSVTEAIFAAGFQSSGRFYATADRELGMTATAFRNGGDGAEIRFAVGECSLGAVLVAQSCRGICAILIGDDAANLLKDLEDRFPNAALFGGDADFEALVARVVGLVEAPGISHDLPLDIRGTAFQRRVWQALCDIPAGTTASYAEIARTIGAPKSARAVALACGANALAVAIPCHRVVRGDGALSGYRWGIARKRALLDREGAS